jgi:hypothetical protein
MLLHGFAGAPHVPQVEVAVEMAQSGMRACRRAFRTIPRRS